MAVGPGLAMGLECFRRRAELRKRDGIVEVQAFLLVLALALRLGVGPGGGGGVGGNGRSHWRGRAGGQAGRGGRGPSAVALRPDPSEWFAKVSASCLACEDAVLDAPAIRRAVTLTAPYEVESVSGPSGNAAWHGQCARHRSRCLGVFDLPRQRAGVQRPGVPTRRCRQESGCAAAAVRQRNVVVPTQRLGLTNQAGMVSACSNGKESR